MVTGPSYPNAGFPMVAVADCVAPVSTPDDDVLVHSSVSAAVTLAVNGTLMPADTVILTPYCVWIVWVFVFMTTLLRPGAIVLGPSSGFSGGL